MSKAEGRKIVIRFTEAITTSVWGNAWQGDIKELGEIVTSHGGWSGYIAANAFDDSEATNWIPGYRILNCWIGIALPNAVNVSKLVIRSTQTHSNWYTGWRLEGSNDGSSWTTIVTSGHTTWRQTLTHEFSPVSFSQYRVFCTARSGDYPGFSLIELWGDVIIPINRDAFTIKGQDPLWVNTGGGQELIEKEYPVDDVTRNGEALNEVAITMTDNSLDWFRNVVGDLTVKYNAASGNLAGLGGPVESFEVSFSPDGLEAKNHPNNAETVGLDIQFPVFAFSKIEYVDNDSHEETVGFNIEFPTFNLIHIDDIEV